MNEFYNNKNVVDNRICDLELKIIEVNKDSVKYQKEFKEQLLAK